MFEEDGVEEAAEVSPTAGSGPGSLSRGASRQVRHDMAKQRLDAALEQSEFKFRSNRPSPKLIEVLISNSNAEEWDTTLATVAKWRSRGMPLSPSASSTLVRKLSKNAVARYDLVLKVLQDRTKYGLQLEDVRALDRTFLALTKPPKTSVQGEASSDGASSATLSPKDARKALQLLEVERFYLSDRPRDPLGLVATAAAIVRVANSPNATESDQQAAQALLSEFKAIGTKEINKVLVAIESKSVKTLMYRQAGTLASEVDRSGKDAAAAQIAREIQHRLAEWAPKERQA